MRSIYRAALAAVVVALTVSAASAGSALAAPEWYSSATKPTPEWQQGGTKLAEAVGTKWKGKVTIEDRGPLEAVECEGAGEGSAGPGGASKLTSWTLSSCTAPPKVLNLKGEEVENVCTSPMEAKVSNLPLGSELTLPEGSSEPYETLTAESPKSVAFALKCKVGVLKILDTCTASTVSAMLGSVSAGVESSLNGEKMACNIGGHEAGYVRATRVIEATKGAKLEANVVEGTYSKVTSSIAVSAANELTLDDTGYGPTTVACPFHIEGTVGSGGKGTITNLSSSASSCKPTGGLCTKVNTIETIHLPWNTELYESEGAIRDRIVSGGGGEPQWRLSCPGGYENTCSVEVSPLLSNGLERNVFATFSEGLTRTTCRKDQKSGEAFWQGQLKLVPSSGAIKFKP